MGTRIAFFNSVMIIICFLTPLVGVHFFSSHFGGENEWKIALGLTWSYRVVMFTNTFLKQLTITSNDLISVSRLDNYIKLEDEGNAYLEKNLGLQKVDLKKDLEKKGPIVAVKNLDLSIHGNRIFNSLSFSVSNGERVAIIGRSGSGSHSIFKVLLNIYQTDSFASK